MNMHSICMYPPPRTRGCPAQGRRGPWAGAPASCAAPTRGGGGGAGGRAALSVCLSDPSHGLSVHLSAYLRLYVCLSVCRSGRRNLNSVRVCLPGRHTVTCHRDSPPTGVCLSESVSQSACVSESVCLLVCLSPSQCHVTTAASAGARVPAARPPASRQEVFFSFTID